MSVNPWKGFFLVLNVGESLERIFQARSLAARFPLKKVPAAKNTRKQEWEAADSPGRKALHDAHIIESHGAMVRRRRGVRAERHMQTPLIGGNLKETKFVGELPSPLFS